MRKKYSSRRSNDDVEYDLMSASMLFSRIHDESVSVLHDAVRSLLPDPDEPVSR